MNTSNSNNVIKAFWGRSNNFGDELTPYLINELSNKKCEWIDCKDPTHKYVVIGSVLNWGLRNATIWGAGTMYTSKNIYGTHFNAVRGNITKNMISKKGYNSKNIAVGDPALILPYLYNPVITKKHKIGIFSHGIDLVDVKNRNKNDYFIISPRDDRETVINNILLCESIISSSLHGLIVAEAYGIKTQWVKFSNKLQGDDSKFHDHYSAIQYNSPTFTDLRNSKNLDEIKDIQCTLKPIPDDIVPNLLHVCPFIDKSIKSILLQKIKTNVNKD